MKRDLSLITDEIRDRVSAKDAAVALGIRVNRYGRCQCPVHHGQDYNMVVYGDNRGWYCHRCKQGGDVIRLVERVNECSFPVAVEWLNSAFQLGLDLGKGEDKKASERAEIARKRRLERREQERRLDRMIYDTYLTAGQIVNSLERDVERYRPARMDEEWDERFVKALKALPDAREWSEWISANVIGVSNSGNDSLR